jgi:hypothetical protein
MPVVNRVKGSAEAQHPHARPRLEMMSEILPTLRHLSCQLIFKRVFGEIQTIV